MRTSFGLPASPASLTRSPIVSPPVANMLARKVVYPSGFGHWILLPQLLEDFPEQGRPGQLLPCRRQSHPRTSAPPRALLSVSSDGVHESSSPCIQGEQVIVGCRDGRRPSLGIELHRLDRARERAADRLPRVDGQEVCAEWRGDAGKLPKPRKERLLCSSRS